MFPLRPSGHDRAAPRAAARWRPASLCAVCRQWGRERVCGACIARFAPFTTRCERCAIEVPAGVAVCGACLAEPPPFERALAAVDYAFPWDGLVARFKFHAGLDLADAFAQRIVGAHVASGRPVPALLLPVPLSAQRLRERGYNQAWELARRVARRLGGRATRDLLLRVKDTPHQIALPLDQRAGNVRGAFAVEPARRAELRGRSVALVDDVVTTGATAGEIARTLHECGAEQVQVWAFARTPRTADA